MKDGLLNKIIVYGRNSVGKTNLGLALFDIVSTLTSNNVSSELYNYYLNADSTMDYAQFARKAAKLGIEIVIEFIKKIIIS